MVSRNPRFFAGRKTLSMLNAHTHHSLAVGDGDVFTAIHAHKTDSMMVEPPSERRGYELDECLIEKWRRDITINRLEKPYK